MKPIHIIAGLLLLVAACTPAPGPATTPDEPTDISLSALESEQAYRNLFSSADGSGIFMGGMAARSMDMAVAESAAPQTTNVDFSETNVQVQGVDEADLIKTDGEYIYTISGQQVFILKAYPADEAEELSIIQMDDFSPQSLFIDGNRLAIIGSEYQYDGPIGILPRSGYTVIHVYDVSDREDPELLESYRFEGGLNQARLKDGSIYVVTTQYNWYGIPELPVIARGDVAERISATSIFRYPVPYDNPQTTLVSSFSLTDLDDPRSVGVVTEGGVTLYMSNDNIYLTSSKSVNTWRIQQQTMIDMIEPELDSDDRNLVRRIRGTDEDILSESEKQSKILQIITRYVDTLSDREQEELEDAYEDAYQQRISSYDYLQTTMLSRIEYADGRMDVKADGEVPGHVNNQFSLDERDGVLRIATTVDRRWDLPEDMQSESENIVTTLDEDLEVLDQVTGLAKTERIFSARYTDDRLYLVTFRQVDPFFVIDLSDPSDIEVLGELKITGFSRYLHPFGENTVIGLGRDATLEGRQQGLKISIFDVSDVSKPEEVASWKADARYGSSQAEFDHHAFLLSQSKNLLVIPYNAYDWEEKDESFQGVLVFHVEEDDVKLRGQISHEPESRWRGQIDRSLWIEDLLYTKSYTQVQIHDLEDLDHIETIDLDVEDERVYPIMYDDVAIGMPSVR